MELFITLAFDIEILWRMLAHLPDWRTFFNNSRNLLDLFLVIVTTIIQIPAVSNSSVYRWLTIFQLFRFYRVILAVPRMRPLLVRAEYAFPLSCHLKLIVRVVLASSIWEHVRSR